MSLDRLAPGLQEGVHSGGGYPLQFGTISVSDGISMGHEGMHFSLVSREVIADSVEVVMQAERLDGSVLLAGCDKSLPGMLMAAARLDLASVFPLRRIDRARLGQAQRRHREGQSRSSTPSRRSARVKAGKMSLDDANRIECAFAPGEGACRRHVHGQHHGIRRRGARDVPPGLHEPGLRGPAP
ncbi:MAG: dihydroxy-acid dehydratase [Galbitalea sp.]